MLSIDRSILGLKLSLQSEQEAHGADDTRTDHPRVHSSPRFRLRRSRRVGISTPRAPQRRARHRHSHIPTRRRRRPADRRRRRRLHRRLDHRRLDDSRRRRGGALGRRGSGRLAGIQLREVRLYVRGERLVPRGRVAGREGRGELGGEGGGVAHGLGDALGGDGGREDEEDRGADAGESSVVSSWFLLCRGSALRCVRGSGSGLLTNR